MVIFTSSVKMNEFWFCFVLLLKIEKISWNSYKKHILSEHLISVSELN